VANKNYKTETPPRNLLQLFIT